MLKKKNLIWYMQTFVWVAIATFLLIQLLHLPNAAVNNELHHSHYDRHDHHYDANILPLLERNVNRSTVMDEKQSLPPLVVTTIDTSLVRNQSNSYPSIVNVSHALPMIEQQRLAKLPPWMRDYFAWHRDARRQYLTPEVWKNHDENTQRPKLFILQCLESDGKCGGTADRLKPLPLMLMAAARSQRIFLIRWNRPCPLEEFLVPPSFALSSSSAAVAGDGNIVSSPILDWRVPDWLDEELGNDYEKYDRIHIKNVDYVLPKTATSDRYLIITALIQWHDGGQLIYDAQPETVRKDEFRSIYHDLFRLVFEPTPPIAQQLRHIQSTRGLIPGQYAVAQYRAFYRERVEAPSVQDQEVTGVNAANCASQLRPGGPIYFASDSKYAVAAVQAYAKQTGRFIVTSQDLQDDNNNDDQEENNTSVSQPPRPPPREILHLDRIPPLLLTDGKRVNKTAIHDLYPVFVDLYLMGNGQCLSYGDGGFARYGLILSFNHTCENRHWWKRKMLPCTWVERS